MAHNSVLMLHKKLVFDFQPIFYMFTDQETQKSYTIDIIKKSEYDYTLTELQKNYYSPKIK